MLKGGKTAYVHCAPKGTPDLLVIIPGFRAEHVWLEVKTKTSKQSKEQLLWEQWARVNGAKHAVVRSISEALVAVFEAKRGAA
ncbi:MAG TPA: hypothetical protein VER11_34655 [Polyangiaceae bacterium]|nr:hypothetical protein [Polyangiaceae bacterium]